VDGPGELPLLIELLISIAGEGLSPCSRVFVA
jgi:hypothetical protein